MPTRTAQCRLNAKDRRDATLAKVKRAIKQLQKDNKAIDFKTLAKASGVSLAWLYKEPAIKALILDLRGQNSQDTSSELEVFSHLLTLYYKLESRLRKLEQDSQNNSANSHI